MLSNGSSRGGDIATNEDRTASDKVAQTSLLLEIFEKHSAGLLFLSPTGTILLASKAAVRMLLGRTAADSQELSSAALEKKTFVDLLPSSHKAAAEEFLRQIAPSARMRQSWFSGRTPSLLVVSWQSV